MLRLIITKMHVHCAKSSNERRFARVIQNGAASGCGGKRVADRGAGRQHKGVSAGRDERMVKGREGEGRAALCARIR